MKWNIDELKDKISLLEDRINCVLDAEQVYSLSQDLCNLKEMVNFSTGKLIYPISETTLSDKMLDTQYFEDMINFLKKQKKDISTALYCASDLHHVPWKTVVFQRLDIQEYDILLDIFLKNFDLELWNLYNEYKKENRIELNKRKYEKSSTCMGMCHHILSEGKSYISARCGHYISDLTVLPHELAHAYQMVNDQSFGSVQNKINSLLCESYPIFVEYAFIDFLSQTKYFEKATSKEGEKISDFLCTLEYGFEGLLKVSESKSFYNREMSMLILSNLVAFYWLDLYRNNQNDALIQIGEFNANFGKESISEFFEKNNLQQMTRSLNKIIDEYRRKYYSKKQC